MHSSPRKSPALTSVIVASFPVAEMTVTLSLPFLHIKNCVGPVSLDEGCLVLFQAKNRPSDAGLREERLRIKIAVSIFLLLRGWSKP